VARKQEEVGEELKKEHRWYDFNMGEMLEKWRETGKGTRKG